MKKSTVLGNVLICCLLCITSLTSAETLRVGYFELIPHAFPGPQGRARGPMIEFFREIAQKMGINETDFYEAPLSRLVKSLEQGQLDALLYMAKNPEREKLFRYPNVPFVEIRMALAVKMSNPLQAVTSAADLASFTIGTRSGISYLPAILQDERIRLEPLYGSGDVLKRNLKKLAVGRIDAVFESGLGTLKFWAKQMGMESEIRLIPLPGPTLKLYTIFSKNTPQDSVFRYEEALKDFLQEQTYDTLFESYYEESPDMLEWLRR